MDNFLPNEYDASPHGENYQGNMQAIPKNLYETVRRQMKSVEAAVEVKVHDAILTEVYIKALYSVRLL